MLGGKNSILSIEYLCKAILNGGGNFYLDKLKTKTEFFIAKQISPKCFKIKYYATDNNNELIVDKTSKNCYKVYSVEKTIGVVVKSFQSFREAMCFVSDKISNNVVSQK